MYIPQDTVADLLVAGAQPVTFKHLNGQSLHLSVDEYVLTPIRYIMDNWRDTIAYE